MKYFEEIKVTEQKLVDVTCDCCGKSCMIDQQAEFLNLSTYWGFYSNKDLEHWEAHLCEQCVDEKLSFITFKKESYLPR